MLCRHKGHCLSSFFLSRQAPFRGFVPCGVSHAFLCCLLILCLNGGRSSPAFAKPAIPSISKSSISGAHPKEHLHILEGTTERYSYHVQYPSVGNILVDAQVALWVQNQIDTFTRGLDDIPANDPSHFSLSIKYHLGDPTRNSVSVVFFIQTSMGGAQPDQGMVTFTFDRKKGTAITYSDVFDQPLGLLPFLSARCYSELAKRPWAEVDRRALIVGTSPDLFNFSLFSLEPTGITVYFPENQVAPAAVGMQQVHIPLHELTPFRPHLSYWGSPITFPD